MHLTSKHSTINVAEVEPDAMCTNRKLLGGPLGPINLKKSSSTR